jgi:hypothetical protein
MKKIVMMIGIIVCFGIMVSGVNFSNPPAHAVQIKKNCFGYTIIEAGQGINCNGDTIQLEKNYGHYELVKRFDRNTDGKSRVN